MGQRWSLPVFVQPMNCEWFLHEKKLFIFLVVLGLHCYIQLFSSCGERGLLFIAVLWLLTAAVSLVDEHRL